MPNLQNCCRPSHPLPSNIGEPCVSNYRNKSVAKRPNCRSHAMQNPAALAAVDLISFETTYANPCQNTNVDCCMSIQKKNLGHPLYHKWYTKTIPHKNYPTHYIIPPMDYSAYLSAMQGMSSNYQKPSCYTSKRDCEKAKFKREFEQGYHQPPKNCGRCQHIKIMRNLPHCCKCTCQWAETRENRSCWRQSERPKGTKCTDHGQKNQNNVRQKPCKTKNCKEENYTTDFNENETTGQEQEKECPPFEPVPPPTGPISTYRAEYKPPRCTGRLFYPEPDVKHSIEHRPPWNKSTRACGAGCSPAVCADTIRSTEAKLHELNKLLKHCN